MKQIFLLSLLLSLPSIAMDLNTDNSSHEKFNFNESLLRAMKIRAMKKKDEKKLYNGNEGWGLYEEIHHAVAGKDIEKVEHLLKNGTNVNTRTESSGLASPSYSSKLTPLHIAARKGFVAIAKLLLTYKADTEIINFHRRTALSYAAEYGHQGIVDLLVSHGSKITKPNGKWGTPLQLAAREGHTDIVLSLINAKADIEESQHVEFHYQMREHPKQRYFTGCVLARGAILTPLLLAACHGKPEVVRILIQHGANVNAICKQTEQWEKIDSDEIDSDEISFGGWKEETALGWAARNGHTIVAKMLIDAKADVNKGNKFGATPLGWASKNGQKEIAHFLLLAGADVNKRNNNGDTPFALAMVEGNIDLIKLLIQYKANPNLTNNQGWSPLHIAIFHKQFRAIELLLTHRRLKEIKINQIIQEGQDKDKTPLDMAIENYFKNEKKVETKIEELKMIWFLLINKATINKTDKQTFKTFLILPEFDIVCQDREKYIHYYF